jgi:heterodisulfide reductase subunit D
MLEEYRQQLYACSRCGFCRVWGWEGVEHVCPLYPYAPGWETQYARGRVRMAQATLEGEVEISEAFLDHAYACTMCGSCEAHCPVGLPLNDILHAWRVDLAEAGHVLPTHERIVALTERYLNPYGPKPDESPVDEARPAEGQYRKGARETGTAGLRSGKRVAPGHKASVLYYPGCTTNRMAPEIVEAVSGVLRKLELDYSVFEDDTCCGFPLYEIGQVEKAQGVARVTLERIQQQKPEVLLTTCPSCYETFKYLLPGEMGLAVDFQVVHISEFALSQIPGRLAEMRDPGSPGSSLAPRTPVTWHDPCVLGRHLGMYEEPRELLKALPGLELVEMRSNRKDSLCCGAGGGAYFTSQRLANEAVVHRLKQAVESGAEQIVTSCPNCYVRFRQMSRHHRIKIEAKDLSQVLNEALK